METLGLEKIINVMNIIFYVPAGSKAQIYLNQCENVTIIVYQLGGRPEEPSTEDPNNPILVLWKTGKKSRKRIRLIL